jgi:hypothetical protein
MGKDANRFHIKKVNLEIFKEHVNVVT